MDYMVKAFCVDTPDDQYIPVLIIPKQFVQWNGMASEGISGTEGRCSAVATLIMGWLIMGFGWIGGSGTLSMLGGGFFPLMKTVTIINQMIPIKQSKHLPFTADLHCKSQNKLQRQNKQPQLSEYISVLHWISIDMSENWDS
jgi:hypothetical protein